MFMLCYERRKACKELYIVKKKKAERAGMCMVNWSKHTKHALIFNCSNTTQDKIKARKEAIDADVRRGGARVCKTCNLADSLSIHIISGSNSFP